MSQTHTDSSSAQSASPSPATTMTSTQADNAADNSLDDIFGSSPPRGERELHAPHRAAEETTTSGQASRSTHEPSDLPSLRRQHVTAGYRDGVSMAKGQHVQDGFDAGFPVGAQMGMRAGTILGILEGLLRGFEERSGPGVVKKPVVRGGAALSTREEKGKTNVDEGADLRRQKREQVRALYQAALKELDVQAVFAGGGEGGAAVPAEVVPESRSKEGESAEAQLARKGDVVISKWEERVAVPRWEENMEALEMREKEKEQENRGQSAGSESASGAGASAALAVEQS
ncbi:hypothetical protein PENANT_c017G08751 [Penicillium antarcticum]|uniref:Protein YAE1 n=1 Tax=Penicillium antarcticum TaxID=416450 RepID=A0A1V6Q341_9EURO|nr:uncharacterized protein N7508_005367 [Penicillium antarcticum]KAJ5306352.1 hypothetical protein N7508_005367 [Penicillium antarcticum]OQD83292.1 hypothetical protein PENANT_c017G08751 [Penicillium antarcticum]